MWFARPLFQLCDDLKRRGLEPRFEVGDVVVRGFADLGFEEFQVLPGPRILSLTAATVTALPDQHRGHFFWIPSVDEAVSLVERSGVEALTCTREDERLWRVHGVSGSGSVEAQAPHLHEALLRLLVQVYVAEAIERG
jgi:hypothetical protein